MAIQLGSAYGKVDLDVKGLLNGVKQSKAGMMTLAGLGEQVGAGMKRAGQLMTVGLTLPLAALGAASIKAASDLEETRNKVKVVFGDMSESMLQWGKDAATAFGMSQQQALEAAGTFGNLFTSMGLGKGPAADMSQGLVKLAADLASFNNLDPGIVLEKLRSGLVGEVEPLRTLGINLTMNATKAKAMEMGLADANGEVSQSALLQARYALILEQSANAQGDFARTADGLANSSRIMNAQWKDALAILGKNLLPIALAVVKTLNRMLEAFNNMSPFQQKVILGFLALLAVMGPVLMVLGSLISFISTIAGFAGTLSGLGISLAGIGTVITGTLLPAVGALLTALAPVLLILAAIAVAVGILYLMWKYNIFGMRDVFNNAIKVIKRVWEAFMAFWRGDTEEGMAIINDLFKNFRENLARIFNFTAFAQNFQNFVNWIRTALTQVRNYISTAFTNVNWGQVGRFILLGLANGMLLGLPNLLLIAKRIADSLLAQIKRSLGISSPSREAMKLGIFTAQGFQLGLQKVSPEDMARSLARPITNMNTSTQQTIIQNFASGLTTTQVRGMIAENNEALMSTMIGALNG
jgi:hypothetical protein